MGLDEGGKAAKATSDQPPRASVKSGFAGMLTVNDIIHLIQYYYKNSSYDNASKDVETFRLEKLKGEWSVSSVDSHALTPGQHLSFRH